VPNVFISYSRVDGAFVRELHASLTAAGRDVWVDWEDIPPAAKWQHDINNSIDGAESFVFVISPSSLASEHCEAELRHAEERGKRIVPLAIDGADPVEAPPGLSELNWIWYRENDDRDAAFAALSSALDTDLEWARAHTRLLVRAVEWDTRRDGSLLLRGKDLDEAERVLAANRGKEPRPTKLQDQYLHESRRAARRRQRTLLGGVTTALAVSIVLGVLALLQRNDARRATRAATSAALASTATDRVASHPDQALLLALDAYASSPSADARNAVVTTLEKARELGVSEFVHGDSEVRDVALSRNGRALAVGSADGAVRLWDVAAWKQAVSLDETGTKPIVSVGFNRDGRVVGAGSEDGVVRLWDARSGGPPANVLRAKRAIAAIAVSPDGRSVAVLGQLGGVFLWDVGSRGMRRLALRRRYSGQLLAFSNDGEMLAAGTVDTDPESGGKGGVQLWDVASGRRLHDLANELPPSALAFAPRGRMLATNGGPEADPSHDQLRLLSVPRLTEVASLPSPSAITDLAFARHGPTLVAGRLDGSVRRAARADGRWTWIDAPLQAFPRSVTSVTLSPDARTIAVTASGAATVRVWTLDGRPPFGRVIGINPPGSGYHTFRPDGVAFSPDGRTVAAILGDDVLVTPTGSTAKRKPYRLKGQPLNPFASLAFNGNASMLAARRYDGSVQVWRGRRSLPPGVGGAHGAFSFDRAAQSGRALSPDGRTLAVAPSFGSVRLWDVRGHRTLGQPLPHTSGGAGRPPVSGLAFSPDGRVLATDDGQVVRLWEGILWRNLADLRMQVCSLVAGDLTRAEWASVAPGIAYRRACG
jgi:WD40 repeat protein